MAAKKGSLSINSENIFPIIKKWLYSDHDIFVREMISKIQTHRKETEGLTVTDRIVLKYSGNDKLAEVIEKKKDYLASEVLAVEISKGTGDNSKEWNVNGEKITFSVVKA